MLLSAGKLMVAERVTFNSLSSPTNEVACFTSLTQKAAFRTKRGCKSFWVVHDSGSRSEAAAGGASSTILPAAMETPLFAEISTSDAVRASMPVTNVVGFCVAKRNVTVSPAGRMLVVRVSSMLDVDVSPCTVQPAGASPSKLAGEVKLPLARPVKVTTTPIWSGTLLAKVKVRKFGVERKEVSCLTFLMTKLGVRKKKGCVSSGAWLSIPVGQ
mmetsp:Transcript_53962/g.128231  ORF Transcript_53962/g.128231 Transcript_53962/m.128231 type:complete len:214 (+) Transcript_53962:2281-2922(+)